MHAIVTGSLGLLGTVVVDACHAEGWRPPQAAPMIRTVRIRMAREYPPLA